MSYWEKLSHLVEGYSIKWQWSDRRGRLAIPNNILVQRQARERSLVVHGAHLFNNVRNENSWDFALFRNEHIFVSDS